MAGAGCLRWLGSAREERQWWSRGVAEGTDKEVGGALNVGAELGALIGSLEGYWGGISWRHDNAVVATGGGGKGQLKGRGAPFKGRTRRWSRAAEMVGGTVGGSSQRSHGRTRQRLWSECGRHGGAVVQTVWLTGGPMKFYIFQNYPNKLNLGN
jgi:hypothetical protein